MGSNFYKIYHAYDIGDQSAYFEFDDSITPKEIEDIAVYFQFKAEKIDSAINIENEVIVKFFIALGASPLPQKNLQNFHVYKIDMYKSREERFLDYEYIYKHYDKKYSSEAEAVLNTITHT